LREEGVEGEDELEDTSLLSLVLHDGGEDELEGREGGEFEELLEIESSPLDSSLDCVAFCLTGPRTEQLCLCGLPSCFTLEQAPQSSHMEAWPLSNSFTLPLFLYFWRSFV